jgi:ABC-2 type transport system permease protein
MGMQLNVLRKSLRDQRWQIIGFGLALFLMAALIVAIWPSYRNTVASIQLPEAVQAFLGSDLNYSMASGFISAEYFSWIPVLLIIYAVIQGTGAVAGEESSGTIDLLMAQPITRANMVLQKTIAATIGSVLIIGFGFLGFAVTIPLVKIEISVGDAALASANMLPITLFHFALALWLGSVAPNRATAVAIAVAVATAGYFLNTVAAIVGSVSWLQYASPFYYYGAGLPLVKGLDWAHIAALMGPTLFLVAWAMHSFDKRDIIVGGASNVRLRDLLRRVTG